MIAVSTSPFNISMLRKFNVWYSVKDGSFNDPDVWISNGKKKHNFPQPGDDVYISNNVTVEFNNTVRNVYLSGKLDFLSQGGGQITFTIAGDLQATGTIDMTGVNGRPSQISLGGQNNFISTFIPGTHGIIYYNGLQDQDIMNLSYDNLIIGGAGFKNIFGALTISGTTIITELANVVKKTTDRLIFIGHVGNNGAQKTSFDNSINAELEFRGGIDIDIRGTFLNFGTARIYFNGTQSIQLGGGGLNNSSRNIYNDCLIMGSSYLTIEEDLPHGSPIVARGVWNGETPSSTLNVDGIFWQANATEPMATGIYNYKHGVNSEIGYIFDGDYTLPYTDYAYLTIQGAGIKTLSGDTTLSKVLNVDGNLDLGADAITVAGITNLGAGALTKNSSAGLTKFIGVVNMGGTIFNFSGGCTIEFQNGFNGDIRGFTAFSIAAGCFVNFTTNNQFIALGGGSFTIDADVLISGPVTLSLMNTVRFILNGKLNGDNSLSKFINQPGRDALVFKYNNSQEPMQTGILISTDPATFEYGSLLDQDICQGTYYNLTLDGAGVKKLLGNVSVINTYTLMPPATLNSNGHTLTNP